MSRVPSSKVGSSVHQVGCGVWETRWFEWHVQMQHFTGLLVCNRPLQQGLGNISVHQIPQDPHQKMRVLVGITTLSLSLHSVWACTAAQSWACFLSSLHPPLHAKQSSTETVQRCCLTQCGALACSAEGVLVTHPEVMLSDTPGTLQHQPQSDRDEHLEHAPNPWKTAHLMALKPYDLKT